MRKMYLILLLIIATLVVIISGCEGDISNKDYICFDELPFHYPSKILHGEICTAINNTFGYVYLPLIEADRLSQIKPEYKIDNGVYSYRHRYLLNFVVFYDGKFLVEGFGEGTISPEYFHALRIDKDGNGVVVGEVFKGEEWHSPMLPNYGYEKVIYCD